MTRRAMALLLVLMVMTMSVASVVSLAQLSTSSRLSNDLALDERSCDDLLRASHRAILHWLQRDASRAVVPVGLAEPRIDVLDDWWTLKDNRQQRIAIAAWDQLGMVPHSHLHNASPLRTLLSDQIARAARAWRSTTSQAGLDMLQPHPALDRFPSRSNRRPAIGARVATHNPRRIRRSPSDAGAVNINTAPIKLVREAMRLAQRDGIEKVLAARRDGRLAPLPAGSRETDNPIAPHLVGRSDAWSFRIDISSGGVTKSWWCVYLFDGSTWSLAQRLSIDA